MTASRMEIGDHGGHHYGAIKAPVEEHPLLPPKSPKRASRRSLVVGGIVVLAFVLATQARRTTSVTTTTITSTEDGGSSREEENITERQQPVVNSNMARLEVQSRKCLYSCPPSYSKYGTCREDLRAPLMHSWGFLERMTPQSKQSNTTYI